MSAPRDLILVHHWPDWYPPAAQATPLNFAAARLKNMDMAGRMTACNMGIEAGARVAMIAPDETTFQFIQDRDMAPKGQVWERAKAHWLNLRSDADAVFERELQFDAADIEPQITWGTSPERTCCASTVVVPQAVNAHQAARPGIHWPATRHQADGRND